MAAGMLKLQKVSKTDKRNGVSNSPIVVDLIEAFANDRFVRHDSFRLDPVDALLYVGDGGCNLNQRSLCIDVGWSIIVSNLGGEKRAIRQLQFLIGLELGKSVGFLCGELDLSSRLSF